MRIMGLDIGEKRIGVAMSDETGTIAAGRETVVRTNDREAALKIAGMAVENGVKRIIAGFPLNMDGTEGPSAADCRKFAALVEKESAIPVTLWDERLSTREAERAMLEADLSRKKRKKKVDMLAAQLILQSYLDSAQQ